MSLVECDKFKLHRSCLVVTGTIMISGFCVLLTLSRYLGGQHNIEQLLIFVTFGLEQCFVFV